MPLNADHEWVTPEVVERLELVDHLIEAHGATQSQVVLLGATSRFLGEMHQLSHTTGRPSARRTPTDELPAIGRWSSADPARELVIPTPPDTPDVVPDPDSDFGGSLSITGEVEFFAWQAGWIAGYKTALEAQQ